MDNYLITYMIVNIHFLIFFWATSFFEVLGGVFVFFVMTQV